MLFAAALGVTVLFALVVLLTLVWARAKVAKQHGATQREQLLRQAAIAAGDASGREMFKLLETLEQEPPGCPVTLDWVPRAAYEGKPPCILVKITWDGNEWRRLIDQQALKAMLEDYLADRPPSARLARLRHDLEAV